MNRGPASAAGDVFAPARAWMDCHVLPNGPGALGVAVSGGGDSTALLLFLRDWSAARGMPVSAITVDHGLRPAAAEEARAVAALCAGLGVPHAVRPCAPGSLRNGNLQDTARTARRRLIADWAAETGVDTVALGHTRDDQAETVLMNLARGSGVEGLCGIPDRVARHGLLWIRPLLGVSRADLRAELRARGMSWSEDPSNDDLRFARVRARRLLSDLGQLGLTADRLVQTAARMQDARAVLQERAGALADEVRLEDGDLLVPLGAFRAAPCDTRHRTLAGLMTLLSGALHRPRYRPLTELAARLVEGRGGGTLHGVRVSLGRDRAGAPGSRLIRLAREHAAVARLQSAPGEPWDNRWRLDVDTPDPNFTVRAMGAAAQGPLPASRPSTLPRSSLMATPALWIGDTLIAAPLAGLPGPQDLGVRCTALLTPTDVRAVFA